MEAGGFNIADIVVVIVVLISGAIAYLRGFVREALGIAAWVGAAFAAVLIFPFVQPTARDLIGIEMVADASAWLAIFLIALILLSLVSGAVANTIRETGLSAVDRSLGFVFGLVRGVAVLSIVYFLALQLMPQPEPPQWLRTARTFPILAEGARLVGALVPLGSQTKAQLAAEEARRKAEAAAKAQQALQELTSPTPKPAEPAPGQPGYNPDERKDLERLIQGKQ